MREKIINTQENTQENTQKNSQENTQEYADLKDFAALISKIPEQKHAEFSGYIRAVRDLEKIFREAFNHFTENACENADENAGENLNKKPDKKKNFDRTELIAALARVYCPAREQFNWLSCRAAARGENADWLNQTAEKEKIVMRSAIRIAAALGISETELESATHRRNADGIE